MIKTYLRGCLDFKLNFVVLYLGKEQRGNLSGKETSQDDGSTEDLRRDGVVRPLRK